MSSGKISKNLKKRLDLINKLTTDDQGTVCNVVAVVIVIDIVLLCMFKPRLRSGFISPLINSVFYGIEISENIFNPSDAELLKDPPLVCLT